MRRTSQPRLRQTSYQTTVRTCGLFDLHLAALSKVVRANREREASYSVSDQSPRCDIQRVAHLLIFPEDVGGEISRGPTSSQGLTDS